MVSVRCVTRVVRYVVVLGVLLSAWQMGGPGTAVHASQWKSAAGATDSAQRTAFAAQLLPLTSVSLCGTVSAYTPATLVTAGSITIGGQTLAIAPGAVLTGVLVLLGSDLCLSAQLNASGQIQSGTVSADVGASISVCGPVTAYTAATALTPGLLTIGGQALVIAPGASLTGTPISVGSNLCVQASTNGLGQISNGTVSLNTTTTVQVCGTVTAYTAATASLPGSITIGGQTFTIAPGTTLAGDAITVGANVTATLTVNTLGAIVSGTVTLGGCATNTPVPTSTAVPTSTNTPVATFTATATLTAVPPDATPTATGTPIGGTATAGPTSTATNTGGGLTATPTNTPVGPTATPTNTAVGPTATPTSTGTGPNVTPTSTGTGPTPTSTAHSGTATSTPAPGGTIGPTPTTVPTPSGGTPQPTSTTGAGNGATPTPGSGGPSATATSTSSGGGPAATATATATSGTGSTGGPTMTEYLLPGTTSGSGNGGGRGPWQFARDRHGNIWFTEYLAGALGEILAGTHTLREYRLHGPHTYPMGLTTDSAGHVWVVERAGNRIDRLVLKKGKSTLTSWQLPHRFSSPQEITLGTGKTLWLTEHAGRVARFDPRTDKLSEYTLRRGFQPYGITVDSHGPTFVNQSANMQSWATLTANGGMRLRVKTLPWKASDPTLMGRGAKGSYVAMPMADGFAHLNQPSTVTMTLSPRTYALKGTSLPRDIGAKKLTPFDSTVKVVTRMAKRTGRRGNVLWRLPPHPGHPFDVNVDPRGTQVWLSEQRVPIVAATSLKNRHITDYVLSRPHPGLRGILVTRRSSGVRVWIAEFYANRIGLLDAP